MNDNPKTLDSGDVRLMQIFNSIWDWTPTQNRLYLKGGSVSPYTNPDNLPVLAKAGVAVAAVVLVAVLLTISNK